MSAVNPRHLSILHTECSTGAGGQVLRILRESRLLADRGHRLAIACRPDSALSGLAQQAGLDVHHIDFPIRGAFGVRLISSLVSLMRRLRPDVVNTHSSVDSWSAGVAARIMRVPVVVRTRHIQAAVSANFANRLLYGRIANRVVTTGERVADILAADLGLPRAHFVSIPTGVDLARFNGVGEREKIRAEWGLRANQPAIGILGVLRSMKHHDLFIQAAGRLHPHRPDLRWFIIGDGPLRPTLENFVRSLHLEDVVTFTGHRTDVPDVLAALDMVVLCSARSEGFPQVISQALAMRRPVVATDVGSVREAIRNEETGLLIEPENLEQLCQGVERLLDDPPLAARLADAGRQLIADRYSETRMADATEKLLLELRGKA
jgi:glycosyltransferase involved in cell wall biosynthesis